MASARLPRRACDQPSSRDGVIEANRTKSARWSAVAAVGSSSARAISQHRDDMGIRGRTQQHVVRGAILRRAQERELLLRPLRQYRLLHAPYVIEDAEFGCSSIERRTCSTSLPCVNPHDEDPYFMKPPMAADGRAISFGSI